MHFRVNESNFATLRDRDQPSSELFEMAREVRTVIESPGWQTIMALVEESRQYHFHVLTADHADYSEMSRRLGIVEGLRVAEAAVEAVLEKDARVREQLDRLASSGQGGSNGGV